MKTIKILSLLLSIALIAFSCSDDDLDGDALTDLPPGILSVSPLNNGKVVLGDFDIKVIFADGNNSPLASATVTLNDEFGNMLATKTQALSGTRDSIVLEAAEFGASQLGPGGYEIDILATDASGNELTRTTSFEISLQAFPANHDAIYLAGAFNGWDTEGTHPLELVGPNTWEIKEVDLMGQAWKLKNTLDWTDEDWGDSNCDGIMESNKVGNGDTDCGFNGLVNISFNDQTLAYTVRPSIEFDTDLSGLYMLGSFNDFSGGDYGFALVDDNTWVLNEILLGPGDKFRFAEYPNFMGRNWGAGEEAGIVEEFSEMNIVLPDDFVKGIYSVTFDEKALGYTLSFVRGLFPENLYLVGGLAAHGGWDAGSSIPFMRVAEGVFEIYAPFESGQGFKFLQEQSFNGDWGIDPADPGKIVQEGEQDASVAEDGFYLIRIDFTDNSAAFTKTEWGIIGSATPGGWDSDTDMTLENDFDWVITLDLVDGEVKFRANDDWPINFGDDEGDGTLDFNSGTNIQVPDGAGNYTVTMSLRPEGYTYEFVKN